jgi:hypothetical protein
VFLRAKPAASSRRRGARLARHFGVVAVDALGFGAARSCACGDGLSDRRSAGKKPSSGGGLRSQEISLPLLFSLDKQGYRLCSRHYERYFYDGLRKHTLDTPKHLRICRSGGGHRLREKSASYHPSPYLPLSSDRSRRRVLRGFKEKVENRLKRTSRRMRK